MRIKLALLAAAVSVSSPAAALAERVYYAICNFESHGGQGWNGPNRTSYAAAEADCAAHMRQYPGHRCNVQIIGN